MTRVRTDNVFGTLTDNPLTAGATTMNSAGLANLAAVSSAEAIIVLDPNRVNGAPEIVIVTAHTGSATSATIQRGQFGTSAREHASGTEWVHGPIASNATSYATAADDQGDFVPMNAWESWTPTLTNLTLGSGTSVGRFTRIGRTIHYFYVFTLGAGSAVGTAPSITLPVAPASTQEARPFGVVNCLDASTNNYEGKVAFSSGSTVALQVWNSAGTYVVAANITSTAPFAWATGDQIQCWGTYEAAS